SSVRFGISSVPIHRASGHQAEARAGSLQACIRRSKWLSSVGDGDHCSQQPMANGLADQGSPSCWVTSAFVVRFKVFTLDQSLLIGSLGALLEADRRGVESRLLEVAALSFADPKP
ncbi:hypothetical protein N9Z61_01810, partial [bacterium]|nr:hypothetical protein [bacterium]MDB4379564.1 hypothetical protein [bacterium]